MRGMRSTYPHGPHQNRGRGPPPDPTSQLLGTLGESLAAGLENLLSMVEQSSSLMRPMSGPMAMSRGLRWPRPARGAGRPAASMAGLGTRPVTGEQGGASTSGQTAAAGVGTASGMSGVEGIAGAVTTTTVIGTTVIGTRAVGTTSISTTTVTMTTVTAPGAGARVIVSPVVGAEMGMTAIAVANGAAMTATARAAWRAGT